MVIGNADAVGGAHPSGIPQDKIDNIMSGIANTGTVKMNNHRKKLRQRFDIIKKLGQGTYGKVQLGINKETGQEVAIKTIKKCKIEAEADLVRIRREVQIMSSVQHPNIIHIYEVFENREKMVLVMEFAAGGELYDYLSERKVLSEEEARRIFRQVATAVYYCHKHKICHRDLKLENILLDEHGNAKIADFGLSNVFDDQRLLATFCGSPLYASPEIVEGTPYQGPEVDCWSLGVLLYTLVYGSMPFDGSNFKRLVKQISQGDYYEPKKPSRASALIRDMLTVCPRKRATIEQICSHWWVNENDNRSCLDLAEDLANQTPVRLDVLLSLTPAAITADQLVVPSADGTAPGKGGDRVPRSHSVGSIRDMGVNTEAERRILDMVAAGGEAALMPSPTRTITPAQSPVQSKRKLENTVSTENAAGLLKKKEKAGSSSFVTDDPRTAIPLNEEDEETPMETEQEEQLPASFSQRDMQNVGDLCTQLIQDKSSNNVSIEKNPTSSETTTSVQQQKSIGKLDSVEESPEEKDAARVIKKFVNKHKTTDLINAIHKALPEPKNQKAESVATDQTTNKTPAKLASQFVRKCSLQDETPLATFNAERGKSRILETAEKFHQMNSGGSGNAEKPKKFVIPGVSVGSFKKEFERKASMPSVPTQGPTTAERRALEQVAAAATAPEATVETPAKTVSGIESNSNPAATQSLSKSNSIEGSDSKNSLTNISLEEARRSMENSIALLRQAQHESSKEVDQLCAKTENIEMRDPAERERERKLKNARAIIGNAIQPASPGGDPNSGTVKTSTAQITLKSATLPRRKTAKTEIKLDIKPRIVEQSPMRFTTEMQHPVADLRSAPARDGPLPYSPPISAAGMNARATSLEPKEHIIPIQRPQVVYTRSGSNATTKSGGSLSRQSTADSESDTTTTNFSQSTVTGSSQPIKKSPREFIIPIAVEGGGFITPREGSIEPSESSHTTSSKSTFSRLRPTRRIGSLLNDSGVDEGLPFHKMRTAAINRDGGGDDDSPFTLHKLRSSRPVKKISQDNDSQSSGEEDDDDGFEILTAENLFSTLLQRVRALTNRLNVNNDISSGFPNSSRLLNNLRQGQSSFWNQEPFGSRLSNARGAVSNIGTPWRHSMSRDLGSDMDSMFSRTGATLPRGNKSSKGQHKPTDGPMHVSNNSVDSAAGMTHNDSAGKLVEQSSIDEPLDLADLDLSRLRLSKKDLETLSSITPGLPKCFQEQLLAKLPPTQARKLSRTLSMQNSPQAATVRVYKRSQSGGRGLKPEPATVPISTDPKEKIGNEAATTHQSSSAASTKTSDENSERSSNLIYQRSLSRNRYDCDAIPPPPNAETSTKSRINNVCPDENNKSLCSSYSSDISDKYKYYSPYLSKTTKDTSTENGSISPLKRYGSVSPRESCHSPNAVGAAAALGRPPSGCLSPPPIAADGGTSSLRRRSSQRRISRFLRPDFFEEPAEENPYQREKKLRERETQSVLREIREKSRESSRDRLSSYECAEILRRKHSLPNEEAIETVKSPARHVRNKSMEMHLERRTGSSSSSQDPSKSHRQSLSRSRELSAPVDKSELADKILQELQILSAVKSQHDHRFSAPAEDSQARNPESAGGEAANADDKEKTATIRKVKKPKLVNEKITESSVDTEPKSTTTVIRKVKKIIKKTDTPKVALVEEPQSSTVEAENTKPESKLKRPKSYPTKDPPPAQLVDSNQKPENTVTALPSKLPMKSFTTTENGAELTSCAQSKSTGTGVTAAEHRDNRLVRPKSYPASKLTPPKITRSGIALPSCTEHNTPSTAKSSSNSRQSTSDEKSTTVTPSGKSSIDSSSSSESRPTAIKKVVKVAKKSKLAQPIALTSAVSSSVQESKEPVLKDLKEKSPEKKANKGLLYAIGQKFEKLRDSAMSKDKKSSSTSSTNAPATNTSGAKQASPGKSSPEKLKEKSKVLKKKKSMEGNTSQADKVLSTPNNDGSTRIAVPAGISNDPAKPKTDKRSRIDAMIRSLRERSVPRSQPTTETHFITRAVSVEEMPGTFNRNAVNKVLGLFKRFEKDGNERKVRNTRSTSNIERQIHGSPASPIYQNVREHPRSDGLKTSPPPMAIKAKASSNKLFTSKNMTERDSVCDCEKNIPPAAPPTKFTCNECFRDQSSTAIMQRHDEPKTHDNIPSSRHEQAQTQNNKDKRKALMLDLVKLEKLDNNSSMCSRSKPYLKGNGIYSNLPPYPGAVNNFSQHNDNTALNNNNNSTANNNNQSAHSYRTSSAHEINRNHLFTPSCENIANYSSDSRSYQDDCASTSTFMSPTDEPELYFDNWSVCSEDNYILAATPSPTVSRLSRTSQLSSPTRGGDASDPNESVIDRIKRRSFYCRFNEKKPKRTSSIVGPAAVRDYYREQQAAVKARSNSNNKPNVPSHERAPSPDITQQFLRPLKLSPLGTELKPPIYKSPHDYATSTTPKPRKSLNDIRPTTSPSFLSRRYGFTSMNSNDGDYLALTSSAVPTRIKTSSGSSSHESNGGYYNTYNPKRRSSCNLNGGLLQSGTNVSSAHNIDGYATVGRRTTRPYDQRTISLLEPPSAHTGYRREPRTVLRDYSTSISRSNAHYRTPTTTRSPNNI